MSSEQHYLNESRCEFAMNVQYLINKGWKIDSIIYGDRRFDIPSRLVIVRGDVRREISPDEIESIYDESEER